MIQINPQLFYVFLLKKTLASVALNAINENMGTPTTLKIPKLRFREPRRNLPSKSSRKNMERDFTINFARAYISQIESLHHKTTRTEVDLAREIPVNGFGIADFVAVFWNPRKLKVKDHNPNVVNFSKITALPIIRSFEIKISNWRRALIQAHRYRYFADVAIVVLPREKLKIAAQYLSTFKAIKVGLWGFSQDNNKIVSLYTPRPNTPLEPKYKPRIIELVTKVSKSQHSA